MLLLLPKIRIDSSFPSFLNKPITRLEPAPSMAVDRPRCTDNGIRGQVRVGLSGSVGQPGKWVRDGWCSQDGDLSGYEQSCLGLLIQLASWRRCDYLAISHTQTLSIAKELLKLVDMDLLGQPAHTTVL